MQPQPLKFFIDTHDTRTGTLPEGLDAAAFAEFYPKYRQACAEEGVVSLRVHAGFADGRVFCFTMAPSVEAVRRAHERLGLPIDTIVEVTTVTPSDMFTAVL